MKPIQKFQSTSPALTGLFDDFFIRDFPNRPPANSFHNVHSVPLVNIQEKDDSFQIEMIVPGMEKNNFNIQLDRNDLVISAELEKGDKPSANGTKYVRREFLVQHFKRRFSLPERVVEADKITAKYENGILYVLLPKREEAKVRPPRAIKIS